MCLSVAVDRPNDVLSKGEHVGYEWMTVHNGSGYRCGYVRVPVGHPWHGKDWDEVNAEVHGGVTFAAADVSCDKPGPDNAWWPGFDCAHGGDAPDRSLGGKEYFNPLGEMLGDNPSEYGTIRTQQYVEQECRSLCEQAMQAAAIDKTPTSTENANVTVDADGG